ncbi:hypothetical protein, partial [Azospirillum brasilense]|uniref:hypothetical protein n=1 Tax=Azospirillum brasilense TaxID=192 RepID=UPI00190A3D2B
MIRKSTNGAGDRFFTINAPEDMAPGGLEITVRATDAGLDLAGEIVPWDEVLPPRRPAVEAAPDLTETDVWLAPAIYRKDGTLVRLLIEQPADSSYDDDANPTADVSTGETWETIGWNNADNTGGETGWQFAGWDWEQDCWTEGRGKVVGWLPYLSAARVSAPASFQQRVRDWALACFGAEIAADKLERNHRFLEEALELVQACGCTHGEARQLVDYVFGRPVGDPAQEAGGALMTLAALCQAQGIDLAGAGETELARVWTKVEAIRAKQASKPKGSPLPMCMPTAPAAPTEAPENWIAFPKDMTDDMAEAIAFSANVCGGIAHDVWVKLMTLGTSVAAPAPR